MLEHERRRSARWVRRKAAVWARGAWLVERVRSAAAVIAWALEDEDDLETALTERVWLAVAAQERDS